MLKVIGEQFLKGSKTMCLFINHTDVILAGIYRIIFQGCFAIGGTGISSAQ